MISFDLPVTDQNYVDDAPPDVSVAANSIGFTLASRGCQVTSDDMIAAAYHLKNQGLLT